MKAEIVAIGTELLMGEIVDTNSAYVASQLPALGIDLYYIHQIGDNLGRIVAVFEQAWSRSDLILTTGGLGPTEDDVTRESIAKLVGEEMRVDPRLEQDLRSYFRGRGIDMPRNNLKQASLIPSGKAIPNPRGTAPGWWVEKGGKIIIAMPGPPGEMREMWANQVRPGLRERIDGVMLVSRTLKITGISEGAVDEMCGELLHGTNPTIGVYAKPDGIHVRLAAKAASDTAASAIIAPVEQRLRATFGDHIWGTDGDTLEGSVGQLLKARGLTLATMESCTGGLLASRITDIPGSSEYFKGGIVAYASEAKIAHGVSRDIIEAHGAVSAETAAAMAKAARARLNADIGVGITGVAGPSMQEGKPVGTVFIAVAHDRAARSQAGTMGRSRADVKTRATTAALFQVRQLLVGLEKG